MKLICTPIALVVASLVSAVDVRAQERTFEELGTVVRPGQTLVVTGNDGEAIKGRLVSLSGQRLVITEARRDEERTFDAASVARVSRADSRLNGFLLGVAAGVAAAGASAASSEWNPDFGQAGAFLFMSAFYGPAVGGLGFLIDGAIKPTVYRKPGPTVRIAPLFRGGGAGVQASLRF